jgi:nucleoside-diphosphate-sugar epimerase
MKILFTGASSFTGFWFIKTLHEAGHEVHASFQKKEEEYQDVRKVRVHKLQGLCNRIFSCSFGERRFLELVESESKWDALCHHAADATDYKSPHFDLASALSNNTHNLPSVLKKLTTKGCHTVILTGSVFEPNEGIGTDKLRAFSPYGLSKGLTFDVFQYFCQQNKINLGKFVIPNPFGPFEEPRFCNYLMKMWLNTETPIIRTPKYIRDNIHVDLLANIYSKFVSEKFLLDQFRTLNPSGYIETQGQFAERFAKEMRSRLNLPCQLEIVEQTEYSEPLVRFNSDFIDPRILYWDEAKAWDGIASYYRELYG